MILSVLEYILNLWTFFSCKLSTSQRLVNFDPRVIFINKGTCDIEIH